MYPRPTFRAVVAAGADGVPGPIGADPLGAVEPPGAVDGLGPAGDDADDSKRRPDTKAAEDRRQRRRDLDRREDLPAGRTQGRGKLEEPAVDRADADHRGDRDREEHDQAADDDLGKQAGPEPQR